MEENRSFWSPDGVTKRLCACSPFCTYSNSICETNFGCYAELSPRTEKVILGCVLDSLNFRCRAEKTVHCCDDSDFCNIHIKFIGTNGSTQAGKAGEDPNTSVIFSTASVFVLIAIVFLIVAGMAFRKWRLARARREAEKQRQRVFNDYKSYLNSVLSGTSSGLPSLVQRTMANEITLVGRIGKGRYGVVWRGMYHNKDIAVKVFSSKYEIGWHRETEMYNSYPCRHENILTYYTSDVCSRQAFTELWLVMQYHKNGSLYSYLQSNPVTYHQMAIMCHSVVAGLVYLHTDIVGSPDKPTIVHRDMKSKNILVKDDLTCCICDLELAIANSIGWENDLLEKGVKNKVGNKRYMAPELLDSTIRARSFSSFKAADMYSLSLVMWEIVMRCIISGMVEDYSVPYLSMVPSDPSYEDMYQIVVVNKQRPLIPNRLLSESSLNGIFAIIKECWRQNPLARLTSLNVKKKLQKMVETMEEDN